MSVSVRVHRSCIFKLSQERDENIDFHFCGKALWRLPRRSVWPGSSLVRLTHSPFFELFSISLAPHLVDCPSLSLALQYLHTQSNTWTKYKNWILRCLRSSNSSYKAVVLRKLSCSVLPWARHLWIWELQIKTVRANHINQKQDQKRIR